MKVRTRNSLLPVLALREREDACLGAARPRSLYVFVIASFALLLLPSGALACSACFGKSDSPMAAGMNWGIFSLLAVIVPVLGGVAGFFIYLARKSATVQLANIPSAALQTEESAAAMEPERELAGTLD